MAALSKGEVMIELCVDPSDPQAYQTIQQAVDQAEIYQAPCRILIQAGHYRENIKVYCNSLDMVGEGDVTIEGNFSAHDLNEKGEVRGTFQTATVFLNGKEIYLENITIMNSAGSDAHAGQASALYIEGDKIRLRNCRLEGHQDTLCLGPLPDNNKDGTPLESAWLKKTFGQQRVVFENCRISGTVDFIFGGGSATFIDCQIHGKERKSPNYLTAASTKVNQAGFIFKNCQVTGESPYYLGRPWRSFAKTRFQNCCFDRQLIAEGWHDWNKLEARQTVCYEEIDCSYAEKPNREDWITVEGAKVDES